MNDPIALALNREQAGGYLRLLENQQGDAGFLDDAHWLRKQMERRGWLPEADATPEAGLQHGSTKWMDELERCASSLNEVRGRLEEDDATSM